MKKRLLALAMAGTMVLGCMTGCGSSDSSEKKSDSAATEKQDVKLTVWGAEEDQEMLGEMIESFKTEYADKANWTINLGVESEATAKDTVLNDPEAAADVFAFADDQLDDLVSAKVLQEITLEPETVIEDNGGSESGSVQAASKDGKLYAYPMTADNGYFMFYNKEYFSETDVESLDKMLAVAKSAGKKVSMTVNDGYYLYAFFAGAGLELYKNEDGTNVCTWNATDTTYKGTDVAQAVLDITANKGFRNVTDAEFATGVKDGSIIAGVSGTWNAATAQEAWGDNYAAVKLPTFTCAGEQVQMASYAGYKLIGVNANSKYAGYAMMLGQYLTNYDNQVIRFEKRGLGPSNVKAADSDTVQTNPAIAALASQAQYATIQRVGDNYWDPAKTLGAILVEGNADGTDLQKLLDNAVDGITAK